MIAIMLTQLSAALSPVALAAAEGDSGTGWLLVLGPAGGGAGYFAMWRYYRNTHTSHSFESETRIEAQPPTGNDAKVNEITGTQKTEIDGENRTNHRQRVQRVE